MSNSVHIPRVIEEEEYEEVVTVASLYHLEGLTQAEVAKRLSISQSKVARLLDRARHEDIAQIVINLPPLYKSQSALEDFLRPKGVNVVSLAPSGEGKNTSFLGMAGSRVLLATLLSVKTETIRVVTACGETLRAVIESFIKLKATDPASFEKLKGKKLEIYPSALYSDSRLIEGLFPHTLVAVWWAMMTKFEDDSPTIEAYTPSLPPNFYELDNDDRVKYLNYHGISKIIEYAKQADIFLLGIGNINDVTYHRVEKQIGVVVKEEEFAGEINYIPIRKDGSQHEEFATTLVGITINDFRNIVKQPDRYVIAVAGGKKLLAIEAALADPICNVLVTDRRIAQGLLEKWKQ